MSVAGNRGGIRTTMVSGQVIRNSWNNFSICLLELVYAENLTSGRLQPPQSRVRAKNFKEFQTGLHKWYISIQNGLGYNTFKESRKIVSFCVAISFTVWVHLIGLEPSYSLSTNDLLPSLVFCHIYNISVGKKYNGLENWNNHNVCGWFESAVSAAHDQHSRPIPWTFLPNISSNSCST